jgi:hypothetical protein
MKKIIVAILCSWLLASAIPAVATPFSTDNSDLWGIPNESGWGVQLVQRAEVIFATLFVYDKTNGPIWYSATLEPLGPREQQTWAGDLVQTNGPWFGTTPYDPAAVKVNVVGQMTFNALSDHTGTLAYSVHGVVVQKSIARLTLRDDDSSGDYVGVLSYSAEGCPNPLDGRRYQNRIDFEMIQSGEALTIISQEQGKSAVCTSKGDWTQYGQFGTSRQVTSSCTDGSHSGNVTLLYEMNVTFTGVVMNFTAPSTNPDSKGCTINGSIYGIAQ